MKLVIATPLYPPDIGGPATYAKTLEEELSKQGVEVRLVSFHTVRHLPKGIAHVVYAIKLFRALRGADILLALDPVSVGLPAALIAFLRAKVFVVKIVGDYAWEQGRQRFGVTDTLDDFVKKPSSKFLLPVVLLRIVQKFVASRANRIIVPSKYLQRIVTSWGVPEAKITVVYNAFDGLPSLADKETTRQELGVSMPLLLSAGRLVPWKGFALLIALLPEIHKTYPGTKLFIAGSGPLERELKQLISDSGLMEHVTLLGDVEHAKLMEYIRAADCFVLNTGYEGLSHQLLEVLAVGTPIVTTNIGGNPELIENEVTGVLVPYNDREALLRAISRVLAEPLAAAHKSMAGKEFVARFTVECMVLHTLSVLHDMIKK